MKVPNIYQMASFDVKSIETFLPRNYIDNEIKTIFLKCEMKDPLHLRTKCSF